MTAQASLEQRLARLEAIEAIKQLKSRYFQACDLKQPDAIRACFASGPVRLSYGRIGEFDSRDAMLAVYTELACSEHIIEMHHGQNPQIEVTSPHSAHATWGLFYYLIDTRQQVATQLGGYYEDEYAMEDGQWVIAASSYSVTSTQIMNLGQGAVQAIFAGGQAPEALDDPSRQAAE